MVEAEREFVLNAAEERDIRFVQLWFTDVLGQLKAFAIPVEELPEVAAPSESGPEASALRREALSEVIAAMSELPPAYRAALTLRHMQQLSYQEVADTLGIPLGTVKTHLHRARAKPSIDEPSNEAPSESASGSSSTGIANAFS